MRLFVAVAIPAPVRERLTSLVAELRRVDGKPRWIPAENLHITVKFIGEVPAEKVATIGEALAAVRDERPVTIEFRGVGFFPSERRPSVAWVGAACSANLALLAAEVNRVLTPLGIAAEEKRFVPHLTIARFKDIQLSPGLRSAIIAQQSLSFGALQTGEFHLMQSTLKSAGAEYTTLQSFRFHRGQEQETKL